MGVLEYSGRPLQTQDMFSHIDYARCVEPAIPISRSHQRYFHIQLLKVTQDCEVREDTRTRTPDIGRAFLRKVPMRLVERFTDSADPAISGKPLHQFVEPITSHVMGPQNISVLEFLRCRL